MSAYDASTNEIPEELTHAVRWWKDQLILSSLHSMDAAVSFERSLAQHIWTDKLSGHWFPRTPLRGQASRSVPTSPGFVNQLD